MAFLVQIPISFQWITALEDNKGNKKDIQYIKQILCRWCFKSNKNGN